MHPETSKFVLILTLRNNVGSRSRMTILDTIHPTNYAMDCERRQLDVRVYEHTLRASGKYETT